MVEDILISVNPEEEKNQKLIENLIYKKLQEKSINAKNHKIESVFSKRSIDARRGKLKINLKFKVYIDQEPDSEEENEIPKWKNVCSQKKVVIVGSGPAGLFAALKLLEDGVCPIILERGKDSSSRRKDIAKISRECFVDENSNYCFGEGGAGTFSDGKLYTRSNKRGNIKRILNILVHFGANPKILTDAHPHIGTEKLPKVINQIRSFIVEKGGEFYFNTKCIGFLIEEKNIKGVQTENLLTGEKLEILCDKVILATGHSANDVYEMIAKINPLALEAKTFAVGVRVEHPRSEIDNIQFHGKTQNMEAAEYVLKTQVEGRGVYSFCMCPGGFVVPSCTSENGIVVNGMSASGRNSKWSNAAIVVETRVEDIPQKFVDEAEKSGCKALAGLYFRTFIESETKKNGEGQKAPSQMLKDFISGRESKELIQTSFTPGVKSARLDLFLPEQISFRLKKAFLDFNKNMKGFISDNAILIASETRTSTPCRILRNSETLESDFIKGLYPAGEGSGYSGGIVSSAMDGEKVASQILKIWKK